jgi:hypothetical protein
MLTTHVTLSDEAPCIHTHDASVLQLYCDVLLCVEDVLP